MGNSMLFVIFMDFFRSVLLMLIFLLLAVVGSGCSASSEKSLGVQEEFQQRNDDETKGDGSDRSRVLDSTLSDKKWKAFLESMDVRKFDLLAASSYKELILTFFRIVLASNNFQQFKHLHYLEDAVSLSFENIDDYEVLIHSKSEDKFINIMSSDDFNFIKKSIINNSSDDINIPFEFINNFNEKMQSRYSSDINKMAQKSKEASIILEATLMRYSYRAYYFVCATYEIKKSGKNFVEDKNKVIFHFLRLKKKTRASGQS